MIFGIKSTINICIAMVGWVIANSGILIDYTQDIVAVVSSIMGVLVIYMSFQTARLNNRIKKLDIEERQRKIRDLKDRKNSTN